jgi:demethylmenaquinone methyltransferase/2-methoxy-6-polyprenyl-1,4-benzoquinol methylase
MSSILQQQIEYYRARAAEYDEWYLRRGRYDRGPVLNQRWFAQDQEVLAALEAFAPSGAVLELACGTGIWTARLLPHASELLAIDTSPEVIAINRARLQSAKVRYVEADVFAWTPPVQFDAVFFGFWLSHVPPQRFDQFWSRVRQALKPGGRFFFVDSRYEPTSTAKDQQLPERTATTLTRRLNDGREFQIYKIFYHPEDLHQRLTQLGWDVELKQTADYFLYGWGGPKQ